MSKITVPRSLRHPSDLPLTSKPLCKEILKILPTTRNLKSAPQCFDGSAGPVSLRENQLISKIFATPFTRTHNSKTELDIAREHLISTKDFQIFVSTQ